MSQSLKPFQPAKAGSVKRVQCMLASQMGAALIGAALIAGSADVSAQSTNQSSSASRPSTAKPSSSAKPAANPVAKQNAQQAKSPRPVASNRQAGPRKASFKAESGSNSLGTRLGLRSEFADLALNSSAVIVMDQETGDVLLEKNPDAALPIASITKVMTAIVTLEADLPLDQTIIISKEDTRLEKTAASRLKVGSAFTRAELLHLALMSSENRAAHALGRTYPGGLEAFARAMNEKAKALGMDSSHFVEPTGLSNGNVASPRDLARLVNAAHGFALIREYSTDRDAILRVGSRDQQFRNTNALTRSDDWDLGLSKTGFIRDAGRCLVMQARLDDRDLIIVMLDAEGKAKRLSDAERIRRWLSTERDRQPAAVRS